MTQTGVVEGLQANEARLEASAPDGQASRVSDVTWLYQGWCRFGTATLHQRSGATYKREVEDHGRAVGVLPYNPVSRTALLVRQTRMAVVMSGSTLDILEIPAGILERDDAAAEARREALEEAGVRLGKIEPVVVAWTMPGMSTEQISLFLAEYSADDRISEGGGLKSENEDITVVELPLSRLAFLATRGELTDMKTLLLTQTLQLRRPELFAPS